jgi:hypothetical protein
VYHKSACTVVVFVTSVVKNPFLCKTYIHIHVLAGCPMSEHVTGGEEYTKMALVS